jgi:hypothetical protein
MQIALSYSNRGAGKAETKLRTNGRIFDFNSFFPLENRLNHGQCFDSTWCILCLPYREQIRSAGLKIKSSWWDVSTTAIDFRVCVRFTNPPFFHSRWFDTWLLVIFWLKNSLICLCHLSCMGLKTRIHTQHLYCNSSTTEKMAGSKTR